MRRTDTACQVARTRIARRPRRDRRDRPASAAGTTATVRAGCGAAAGLGASLRGGGLAGGRGQRHPGLSASHLRSRGRMRSGRLLCRLDRCLLRADEGIDRVLLRSQRSLKGLHAGDSLGGRCLGLREVVTRRGGRSEDATPVSGDAFKDVGALHGSLRVVGEQHRLHAAQPAGFVRTSGDAVDESSTRIDRALRARHRVVLSGQPALRCRELVLHGVVLFDQDLGLVGERLQLLLGCCGIHRRVSMRCAGGQQASRRWQLTRDECGAHETRRHADAAGQGRQERKTRGDATWAISFFLGADRVS